MYRTAQEISDKIQQLRLEKSITVIEMAEALNRSEAGYLNAEQGNRPFTATEIAYAAQKLGIHAAQLLRTDSIHDHPLFANPTPAHKEILRRVQEYHSIKALAGR